MGDESLTPAQRAEYRFLRQQVDGLQEEANRRDHHPNVQQDLHRARRELKEFVFKLRQQGVKI